MTHQRYRASILLEADGSIFENAFFTVRTFYNRTNGAVQHNSRRSCTWAECSALITMCWLQGHTRLLWGMLIGEK